MIRPTGGVAVRYSGTTMNPNPLSFFS